MAKFHDRLYLTNFTVTPVYKSRMFWVKYENDERAGKWNFRNVKARIIDKYVVPLDDEATKMASDMGNLSHMPRKDGKP